VALGLAWHDPEVRIALAGVSWIALCGCDLVFPVSDNGAAGVDAARAWGDFSAPMALGPDPVGLG
jgi:hypothetical protein